MKQRNGSSKTKKQYKKDNQTGSSNGTSSSSSTINGKSRDEHHNLCTPCCNLVRDVAIEIFPDVVCCSAMEAQKNDEDEKTNSSRLFDLEQQPLLGRIIRQHLIEERRKNRGNIAPTSNISANKKKKKKRNKKKKQQANNSTSSAVAASDDDHGNTTNTSAENSSLVQQQKDEKHQNNGRSPQDPPVASHTTSKTAPVDESNKQNNPQQEETSDLDFLLDQCIEQDDSSQKKKQSPSSSSSLDRDLPSFVSFLNSRFEQYQNQTTTNITTATSSKKNKKNTPNQPTNAMSSSSHNSLPLNQNEILPTISLKEVINESDKIYCRLCRTSTTTYLRQITGGGYSNGNGSSSRSIATGGASENGVNGDEKNGCIVIDGGCAKIPRGAASATGPAGSGSTSSLSLPVSAGRRSNSNENDDDDVARAFDYVAMEEGNSPFVPNFTTSTSSNGENGHKEPSKPDFRLTFSPIITTDAENEKREDKSKRLLQLKPLDPENDNNAGTVFPLTVRDIEMIARHILLPCGMSELTDIAKVARERSIALKEAQEEKEEEASAENKLTDEEFKKLQNQITSSISSIKVYIDQLCELKDDIARIFDEIGGGNSASSSANHHPAFDTKMSTKLSECDGKCDSYLDTALELLLTVMEITEMTSSCWLYSNPSGSGSPTSWATKLLNDMWGLYDAALIGTIEPKMLHRGKTIVLAGKDGMVPQSYISIQHRDSYRTMLDDKINFLNDFHERLERMLIGTPFPMMMKEGTRGADDRQQVGVVSSLAGLCAFSSYFADSGTSLLRENDFSSKNELLFREMLDARKVMASKTIQCCKREDLFNIPRGQYEKVKKLHGKLSDLIVEESIRANVRSASDVLRKAWDDLERKEQTLGKDSSLCEEEASALLRSDEEKPSQEDMQRMINLTSIAISKWRLLLFFRYDDKKRQSERTRSKLPLRLKKWLKQLQSSSDQSSSTSETPPSTGERNACEGGGGRRRVACIVTTYLYRWLHDRCMEWHADLTQRELLSAVEEDASFLLGNDDSLNQQSQGTNSGGSNNQRGKKSSKKKKKKAAKAVVNNTSVEANQKGKIDSPEIITALPEKVQKSLSDEIKSSKSDDRADSVTADSASEENRIENDSSVTEVSVTKENDSDNQHENNANNENMHSNFDVEKDIGASGDGKVEEARCSLNIEQDAILTMEQQVEQPEEEEQHHQQYQELVGVIDGKKYQSAEEYLMQRLRNIYRMGDADILPNKITYL